MLHALPVLSALRNRFPEAHLAWAIGDRARSILALRRDLDAIHVFPRRALGATTHPRRLVTLLSPFARKLRAAPFDLVLDLQGNLKSGAVARIARAHTRFGPPRTDAREGNAALVRHRGAEPPFRHRVERNLALAAQAVGAPLPYVDPGFPRAPEVVDTVDALLRDRALAAPFVVLHPGTSDFGAFKRWPPDRFAALGRRLQTTGHRVALTGAPGERALAEQILADLNGHATFVPTPSLPALAEVIARASLFVAADTGPLHLAALVGTPLVGLYGPKDPARYGPYGRMATRVPGPLPVLTQPDVACRPCTLRRCAAPLCMTTLDVDRVFAACVAQLSRA